MMGSRLNSIPEQSYPPARQLLAPPWLAAQYLLLSWEPWRLACFLDLYNVNQREIIGSLSLIP